MSRFGLFLCKKAGKYNKLRKSYSKYRLWRRAAAVMMILSLTAGFAACGLAGEGSQAAAKDAGVQRYAWPLGSSSPEDTVTQIYAEKFADEVDRLSDGKDGDIPFVVQNTAPQVTFMKDTAVFDMPALFDSIDEVREHVDNPKFMKLMQQVYNDGGYELLGYADQGFRVMTTNKKIESLADFKGQKIRTMENSYHMAYWKALGASPTPMTFSEVYIGLQQGTIDAQENPYEVIVSNKLYEQQDYVVETNHLPHLISLIVSEEFMKGMTDEQQQMICVPLSSIFFIFEDSGTQIITLSDEVHEQIRKECQPIYESIEKNVSSDIVDAYLTQ